MEWRPGRLSIGPLKRFPQKSHSIAAILILLAQILPAESQTASAPAWEKVGNGVKYAPYSIATNQGSAFVHLLKVDLKQARLKVLMAPKSSEPLRAEEFAARNPHALAVVNGSFFDESLAGQVSPKGIIISEGRLLRPLLRARAWGVFFIDTRGAHITTPAAYRSSGKVKLALQGLPRLIENGRPLRLKAQTARRTAIGVDSDGAIMILVSRERASLSLEDLARGLRKLGCKSALNLDGGSSTQLWVNRPRSPAITERGPNRVPVALGVFSGSR
jgi:exopolysaccharide biosynthesis protein